MGGGTERAYDLKQDLFQKKKGGDDTGPKKRQRGKNFSNQVSLNGVRRTLGREKERRGFWQQMYVNRTTRKGKGKPWKNTWLYERNGRSRSKCRRGLRLMNDLVSKAGRRKNGR